MVTYRLQCQTTKVWLKKTMSWDEVIPALLRAGPPLCWAWEFRDGFEPLKWQGEDLYREGVKAARNDPARYVRDTYGA